MTTANIVVRKILPGRGNTAVSTNYTGIVGEVTVDTGLDTLRVHDGVTPGGTRLATYDELANVSLGNINLSGYATTAQITAANANAAVQAIAINSINANIGAFQTYANATFAGGAGTYSNANVVAYLTTVAGNIIPSANVVYSLGSATRQWKDLWVSNNTIYIGNVPLTVSNGTLLINGNAITSGSTYSNTNVAAYLVANPQSGTYSNTNVVAYMNSFYTYANATYSTVANAGTQQTQINSINANVTAANAAIASNYSTFLANAAAAHSEINGLRANITAANAAIAALQTGSGFATIEQLTANVSAANSAIVTANTGMKSYVDAVTTAWTANAATQASAITSLQTQIYSNVNTAAYLAGNVTTGNLTVAYNAVVLGNLQVNGTQTTVNTATLNVADLYITVANGAINSAAANGAGLRVAGALANIAYSSVSDSFEFNKSITVGNVIFSNNTRFFNNNVTLPNGQGFNWHFYDPMIGGSTTTLYYNGLVTGFDSWVLETGNGTNAWMLDSDTQEFYLFNGAGDGKLVFGTASNAGTGSINDIELKSTVGNVYITANAEPWTFREDGNLLLPNNMIFTSSPAVSGTGIIFGDNTYQRTAYQGPGPVLVNGVYNAALDSTGNLTVPGSILPNTDNVFDLGSATMRFRHLYVGPGTVYVGNAAIKTTVTGNLILPGITRAVASSAFVEEVEDEGDQSYSFATNPTIIDNAQFELLSGGQVSSFTPATYSSVGIDNEGFIRNITVDTPGSGYANDVANLAEQNMWATEAADPINNFDINDWIQIPFRAETRAGESEYDFNTGGADTGNITFNLNEIGSSGDFVNIVGDEYAQLQSNGNYVYVDNSGAHIEVSTGGGSDRFDFEHVSGTSRIKLPPGGDIVNSNGESVLGGSGNVDLGKFKIVDDNGVAFLTTTDDADGYGGYDIAIAPSGESSAYIQIPNNANSEIGAPLTINSLEANSSVQINTDWADPWIFGSDGTTTLPGAITVDTTYNTLSAEFDGGSGEYYLIIAKIEWPTANVEIQAGDIITKATDPSTSLVVTGAVLDDGFYWLAPTGNSYIAGGTMSFNLSRPKPEWQFNANSTITFPDNTVQTTAYVPYVPVAPVAQDNLMLDGGGAATIYEVTVDYAEGGFSSTRYGVNTPSFNGGGAELEEAINYTLDGGGA